MLVRHSHEIESAPVTMPGASGVTMRLLVGREHGAKNFAMRMFEVEPGGHTPLHQHDYEHEVLVLDGHGQVTGGQTHRPIAPGDVVFIPANEQHQFRNTAEQPLRFICLVPTTDNCGCAAVPGS